MVIKDLHMKKHASLILFLAPFILTTSFTQHGFKNVQNMKDTSVNELTAAEQKDGWQLLFNGKDLTGWRAYKNRTGSSWRVMNGMLCSEKSQDSSNPDLITNDIYENFELAIDWKISPQGNSGILYHVTEDNDQTFESGPEYQLIDDKGFPEKIEDYQHTASNYAMQAPSIDATKAPGEWNHTVITVNKGHVEHWLNGKKVVEYELWSNKWKEQKVAGKWKDVPNYGAAKAGHIALQASHSGVVNTGVCFKNIKIKVL